ncbi:uncharacterized protein LOC119369024 [Triticum dicoccoides]|uniref:uncharacterized protein LOC119369024 n=1 Tax=Triticum dicoccoides TaxID=85692 RepID=UPI00188FEC5E|nr:uncharacterized protein LOC119369024 [Triticum dicoccoides]
MSGSAMAPVELISAQFVSMSTQVFIRFVPNSFAMRTTKIEKEKAKEQKEAAKREAKSKVGYLVQETSVEIPVFPYGYRNCIPVPDWVKIPRGVDRAAYIEANLSTDYLPSTPNKAQFKNLYAQLRQHSYPIASHVLQSSREYVSPEIVRDGKIIPKSNNIGTPVTSYLDKDMRDTYHFIRIWDDNKGGRYIDFLRENASGYVLAFRVFVNLAQAGAARLCYFTDEPEIAVKLSKLFDFAETNLHSSYSIVKLVKFGKNSMVRAVDRFARVYANPAMKEDFKTKLAVHFWLLVLGEAPRSDIFKRRMYKTIFTENEEETAPIGDIYQVCTNSWNYSSKAICLLRLFLLATAMGAVLMEQRPNKIDSSTPHPSLQEYFDELATFRRSAQERCGWISGQNIHDVYDLQKQKVDGKYLYGEDAYNRLSDRCNSLLMFSELVLMVIMRETPYQKLLYLDDYSAKESEKPLVDEAVF